MPYLTEYQSTNNNLAIKGQDVDFTMPSKAEIEIVKTNTAESEVNLARPVVPNVTYLEIVRFFIWSFMVVITQAWRDFVEGRPFRPTLANASVSHYYVRLSPCPIFKMLC